MADPGWRTPSQLERAFAAKLLELDPAGAAGRHEARRGERDVTTRDEPDGMVALWALLPAEHGQAVAKKIEAHARSSSATRAPGDTRTLGERRADALVELLLREAVSSGEPTLHGRRPDIQVTVAWCRRADAAVDAVVSGTAEHLDLYLWGRADGEVTRTGDQASVGELEAMRDDGVG